MGNFLIDQNAIKITKTSIEHRISTEIVDINDEYHKKLIHSLNKSQGDYVEKMKLLVEQEYLMVNALADLYLSTLEYIQEVADEAVMIDQRYSKSKIELGVAPWPN